MKNNLIKCSLAILVVIVFALTIYPRVYTYETFNSGSHVAYIKINNFTGNIWRGGSEGWRLMTK